MFVKNSDSTGPSFRFTNIMSITSLPFLGDISKNNSTDLPMYNVQPIYRTISSWSATRSICLTDVRLFFNVTLFNQTRENARNRMISVRYSLHKIKQIYILTKNSKVSTIKHTATTSNYLSSHLKSLHKC